MLYRQRHLRLPQCDLLWGATPAEAIDSSRPVFGRKHELTPFEIELVLVRLDHVARFIVKTRPKVNRDFQKPICLAKPARFLVKLCAL